MDQQSETSPKHGSDSSGSLPHPHHFDPTAVILIAFVLIIVAFGGGIVVGKYVLSTPQQTNEQQERTKQAVSNGDRNVIQKAPSSKDECVSYGTIPQDEVYEAIPDLVDTQSSYAVTTGKVLEVADTYISVDTGGEANTITNRYYIQNSLKNPKTIQGEFDVTEGECVVVVSHGSNQLDHLISQEDLKKAGE